jgi:hypothetical protein
MKQRLRILFLLGLFLPALFLSGLNAQNQNVAINNTGQAPDASAMLDIFSTSKGLLIPRLSSAQRIGITPLGTTQQGLLVFDKDLNQFWYWDGTQWLPIQGTPGPAGPTGSAGIAGATGSNGTNGSNGATGPQGPAGPTGANGANGTTGPQGPAGPAGAIGVTGPTGFGVGPTGPTGSAGIDGVTGPQGPVGTNGIDGVTGPQGPVGTNGTNGIDGVTGPQGPIGLTGANGIDGATGPQGPAGINGTNGIDGVTGPQGPAGTNGTNGIDGFTGPQGPAGTNGTNGAAGANGATGATGATGVANFYSAVGTTDISMAANAVAQDMSQMTITFTPTKTKAYVCFSASGTYAGTTSAGQYVVFRLWVNGVAQMGRGCATTVGEYDDVTGSHNTWSGSIFVPVTTTIGVATTIKIQWQYASLVANIIWNSTATQANTNRSLIIME